MSLVERNAGGLNFLILSYAHTPVLQNVCILFTHFLKSKNVFSRGFFLKILALCMVSIQERVIVARVRYVKFILLLYWKIRIIHSSLSLLVACGGMDNMVICLMNKFLHKCASLTNFYHITANLIWPQQPWCSVGNCFSSGRVHWLRRLSVLRAFHQRWVDCHGYYWNPLFRRCTHCIRVP